MADLELTAAGVPPVRMNLPVPLQRPFAADPGTLTEWLVANTADLGRDAVLAVLAAMNAKYANVVDPLTQERIDALLRELAEDVLASEGLESFLLESKRSEHDAGILMTTPGEKTCQLFQVLAGEQQLLRCICLSY
jgi:hypothetical protein